MKEEDKLGDVKQWHLEKRIEETINALNRNNMEGIFAKDREAALNEIFKRIPPKVPVSHGGSYTLIELGVTEILNRGEYQYLRRNMPAGDLSLHEVQTESLFSDVYLTSVNAVTTAGELVVMDSTGNRAASLFFGPRKVLVVAGKNKIVTTVEQGLERIKQYVAPVHAKRRNWKLPCTETGHCVDCRDPRRICNKLAVLGYERDKNRITVILVGEDLGL